jgi:response regulator NasT
MPSFDGPAARRRGRRPAALRAAGGVALEAGRTLRDDACCGCFMFLRGAYGPRSRARGRGAARFRSRDDSRARFLHLRGLCNSAAGRALSQRSLRILIVDANAVRAAILEQGLLDAHPAGGVAIEHVRDTVNLLPRIAAIDPDVILIDLENPSRDTLEQMFQVSRTARRPIAMFVDSSDSAAVQAAIDAGVSAYVVDGLRKERVKPILDVTISRFHAFDRLQTELHQAKSALEDRKVIDQAKGILMKRRGLSEEDAYGLLRRAAMNENKKIADLARALVAASSLLETDVGNE